MPIYNTRLSYHTTVLTWRVFVVFFVYRYRVFKMSVQVSAVTPPVWLGEGPHWSHEQQALFFVSIFDKSIHKYDPATGHHTSAKLDDMPGFIIPLGGAAGRFVVGLKLAVVVVAWDGEGAARVERTVARLDAHCPQNRINDAKADPRGRLFVGTMGYEYEPGKFHLKKGSLYRIDSDGSAHRVVRDVDISNGLCWDESERAFYYADSFEYAIRRYDYDVDTGAISNPRIVFRYKDHGLDGIVDGMTIDTDGNLWVANFDGSQVLKIDPRAGSLLQRVAVPALQTTSCTFGGPALDQLYVTSAAMHRGAEPRAPAGATFRVSGLAARGRPDRPVNLQLTQ
ncbi:regucalcin-like isoform X1 [Pararge aegeria]|uniref:regucalcin-like isoform X1 n=1 Tax=Pararge aegeria TaxID=116150 RepID=UPI0019D095F4|nr:regucalcin-like isoform X1 [Pararge aegeria]